MGLFKGKKVSKPKKQNDALNDLVEEHIFSDNFRAELRNHGRLYLEQTIKNYGEFFKKELDETAAQVKLGLKEELTKDLNELMVKLNAEVKEYVASHLTEQFSHYGDAMKQSQEQVLASIQKSAEQQKLSHQKLSDVLEQNIQKQDDAMTKTLTTNSQHLESARQAQDAALKSIIGSAEALQKQYQQLSQMLHKSIANQENMMIEAFQNNMAEVIEHYVKGAISEQFDLKSQLPAIVKQMQAQQKEIADDLRL